MNDITLALAYIGAYALGILTVLGAIAYIIKKYDDRKEKSEDIAMARAVGVVKEAMPGSTILDYGTNP